MARKPATRVEFTLFDVVYEDGSLRSNRRVPSDVLGSLDGDAAARAAAAKSLGFDIDYKRLLREFQSRGYLLRAFYYTAVIEDQDNIPRSDL